MFAKALATNLAAKVYILGRRLAPLEDTASAFLGNIMPVKCGITSKYSLAAAAARVEKDCGFVNCGIANSGAQGPTMYGLPKNRRPTLDEVQKYLWDTPMGGVANASSPDGNVLISDGRPMSIVPATY